MHFPATFPVATVSLILLPICPYEISARRFWWCGFLLLSILDRGQMEEDGGRWDSNLICQNIFHPMLCHSQRNTIGGFYAMAKILCSPRRFLRNRHF